jgi:LacI family transcriptional regulator
MTPKLLLILENFHADWEIARSVSSHLSDHDCTLRLIMDHYEEADGIIRRWKPDLLLIHGDRAPLIKSRRPRIGIFGERTGRPKYNVTIDNRKVSRMGVDYFHARGFHHIAYITGDRTMPFAAQRLEAFEESMNGYGLEPMVYDNRCLSGLNPIKSTDQAIHELGQWLKQAPKPLAVCAHDDIHSLHILEACRQARLQVPEEVAVLGCGNHPVLCTFTTPHLSSIDFPHDQIGTEAARIAEKLLFENDVAPEHIEVKPTRIYTRKSTDIMAVRRPELQRALQFIAENAHSSLQPADVIRAIPASRSKLQRMFRDELGRTILDEIHRRKIAIAKELLEETNLTIDDIAERCGMPGAPSFSRLFSKHTGLAPGRYRQQVQARSTPSEA